MTAAVAAAPATTTGVLFLNCHLFAGTTFGRVYRKLLHRDAARADELCRRIIASGAQVVMLAEVWDTSMRARIAAGVRATHPHTWAPPRGQSRLKLGSGMMFLSAAPIEQCRAVQFDRLTGWDAFSQKCVASVVVCGVAYACTHVEAEGDTKGSAARRANIDQVRQFVRDELAGHPKVVLAGDMNTAE
jgi:exonuclease III